MQDAFVSDHCTGASSKSKQNTYLHMAIILSSFPEPEPCTTFCCYVQGTTADVKNNLLFEKFNINYNNLPQIFRKGSIVYRKQVEEVGKKENGEVIKRLRMRIVVEHEDIIRDGFWTAHPYILSVARSKQQQAHPPSPAAKPQLSLSLR
jgi:hypothetical protein